MPMLRKYRRTLNRLIMNPRTYDIRVQPIKKKLKYWIQNCQSALISNIFLAAWTMTKAGSVFEVYDPNRSFIIVLY